MSLYDATVTTAQQLVDDGVWQTLSFGPGLVDGGSVVDGIDSVEIDTNSGNHSVQGRQPRTGQGVVEPGHLLVGVAAGSPRPRRGRRGERARRGSTGRGGHRPAARSAGPAPSDATDPGTVTRVAPSTWHQDAGMMTRA